MKHVTKRVAMIAIVLTATWRSSRRQYCSSPARPPSSSALAVACLSAKASISALTAASRPRGLWPVTERTYGE